MSSPYPSDWDSRRRRVYRRDNYTCSNCGVRGGAYTNSRSSDGAQLHAHHIVPISKGGSHKTSNLKTLCADCHHAIHQKSAMAPTHRSQRDAGNSGGEDVELTKFEKVVLISLMCGAFLGYIAFMIFGFLLWSFWSGVYVGIAVAVIISGIMISEYIYSVYRRENPK